MSKLVADRNEITDDLDFDAAGNQGFLYVHNEPTHYTDPSGLWPYGFGGPEDPPGAPWKPPLKGPLYPIAITGTWTPGQFFGWRSPLIKQTSWGCGGMAAWRAGVPLNDIGKYIPFDILTMPGATEYATLPEALFAHAALGGNGVIIAVQNNDANWKEAPGSGNFATYFGEYWEWCNEGDSRGRRKIFHAPNLPGGFKHTTYIVVPRFGDQKVLPVKPQGSLDRP